MTIYRWPILLALFLPVILPPSIFANPESDTLLANTYAEQAMNLAVEKPDSSLLYLQFAQNIYAAEGTLYQWVDALYNVAYEIDPAAAIELCKKTALENLPRPPASPREWELLGSVYLLWAYSHQALGQYYDARLCYERALFVFDEKLNTETLRTAAYLHRELGNIYTRFGDYEAAFVLLGKARRTALRFKEYNLAAEISSDIGTALLETGKADAAVDACLSALRLPSLTVVSKGLLESALATVYYQKNMPAPAKAHAEMARADFEKVVRDDLHYSGKVWLSGVMKLLGELNEDDPTAGKYFQESFSLLKSFCNGDTLRREFGKLRLAWAGFYLRQNLLDQALEQQQLALRSVLLGFVENDPANNPKPEKFYPENTIMEALGGKAAVFKQLYDKTGDHQWIEKSLECQDLLFNAEKAYRRVHHYESSKLATLDEASRRTETAINTAWEASLGAGRGKWLEQAFRFAEKSKGLLLFEALRNADANSMANVPSKLLFLEKQLAEQISQLEKRLYSTEQNTSRGTGEAEKLKNEILLRNQDLSSLRRQIETAYPEFYSLKYQQAETTVGEMQRMLRPGQAFIEYFVGDSTLFIFLIKKDGFHVERVRKDFPLETWATQFRSDIEAFQFYGSNRDSLCRTYTTLALRLYQKLLKPIEPYGLPRDLIIVPGGILGFLPFDALLYEAPATPCVFKKYPYLARRHNVSYNYSLSLLQELSSVKRPAAATPFAAFAPAFPENNPSGFEPLLFNMESAGAGKALLGGTVFSKNLATVKVFRDNAALPNILYLATHAKANAGDGDFSFIVLSDGQDGYDTVFVNDIYNMNLAADLVFLGACETGNGQWFNGEGIISLARSFMYAGARSVITTLWSINDESNKDLTVSFFRHLDRGERKDEALWKAKLEQLDNAGQDLYAHPVYWAAYTPIGEMGAVKKGGINWKWLAGGVVLLGLFLLFFRRKRMPGWSR
ncbi:MAG: CHAT domain-containing tetratricopeptide repeat protein [Saprospiraceae bacterium]